MKFRATHLVKDTLIIWACCMVAESFFSSIGALVVASALGFLIIPFTHKQESGFYFIILGCVFWLSTAPILIPGEVRFYLWFAVIPIIAVESALSAAVYVLIHWLRKSRSQRSKSEVITSDLVR